jgi:hypothetical protein
MNDTSPTPTPEISPEFFIRVNDFIEMANRIERRFDTNHAQVAMMHAVCRYGAHHYRSTAKTDDAENREAFADYLSGAVRELVLNNLEEMMGPPASAEKPSEPAAE